MNGLIDNERVELLRAFGSSVTLVHPSEEEMLIALFRGLKDPEEYLEKPYVTRYEGLKKKSAYLAR